MPYKHQSAKILSCQKFLYLPALFLMFGLMLEVFILIAFYSWGMSWRGSLYEDEQPHTLTH